MFCNAVYCIQSVLFLHLQQSEWTESFRAGTYMDMQMKSKSLSEKIIQNPVTQTLVIFISGGWILLEITEYFIENFGLNESARNILLTILAAVFPIVLFYSWYLSRKQARGKGKGNPPRSKKPIAVPESRYKRMLFSFSFSFAII